MKAKHLIIAALSAILLASCDKPSPTIEQSVVYNLSVHTYNDIFDGIYRQMSDIYLYPSNTKITFDTIDTRGIDNSLYWEYSLENATPPQFLQALSTDTTKHSLEAVKGKHKLLIRYRLIRNPKVEIYRFYIHDLNIISDTLICDTLRLQDFYPPEDVIEKQN